MLDVFGSGLTRHNVEDPHDLGGHGVNMSEHIAREGDMASIQELDSQTLVLGA